MLKLIAIVVMGVSMTDVYSNSSTFGTLCVFAALSLFYLVINLLMNELAVQD